MSKSLIIVVVVALILGMYGCSSYNGLVQEDTNVQEKWSQVQTQYQRRSDLIPNLVRTVQGAANFEKRNAGSWFRRPVPRPPASTLRPTS